MDLAVENCTPGRLSGSVDGSARVLGGVRGTPRRVSWGGSSADGVGAPPNGTSHKMLLSVMGDRFHVGSDGHLADVEVAVTLAPAGGPWCTLPARPAF